MARSACERGSRTTLKRAMRAAGIAGLAWFCLAGGVVPANSFGGGANENGVAAPTTIETREQAAAYVTALVEEVVPQLLAVPVPARSDELRRLLEANIDMPGVAQFAMGRYWRLANDDQRTEFVRLFRELVVQTSDAGLANYKGGDLRIAETRPTDDGETLVRSELRLTDGPPVQIDWRLQREQDRFRIRDVVVEGISIRIALRDFFAATTQEKGSTAAALLAAMRELVQSPRREVQ